MTRSLLYVAAVAGAWSAAAIGQPGIAALLLTFMLIHLVLGSDANPN